MIIQYKILNHNNSNSFVNKYVNKLDECISTFQLILRKITAFIPYIFAVNFTKFQKNYSFYTVYICSKFH
jgi:hypothetical protein